MPGGGIELLLVVLAVGCLVAIGRQVSMAGTRSAPARRRPRRATWLREPPVSRDAAERRSLELLRSVVNPDEWDMFTELGFICVTGRRGGRGRRTFAFPRYRYLIYPHLPVVALLPRSMAPVREYCVQFPDHAPGAPTPVLPTGDDVLAKWMTLRADEDRLLAFANVSNVGCQIPLTRIERDIRRYERWIEARERQGRPVPLPA